MIELFLLLMQIVLPLLAFILGISLILKWCGKANSLADGFNKTLTWIHNLLKEDSPVVAIPFPHALDHTLLKNFDNIGETYFKKFTYSHSVQENGCQKILYFIYGQKLDIEISEIMAIDFRNFLMEIENLNVNVVIEVWTYVSDKNLMICFATSQEGINWINQQRANTASRQVLLDRDMELIE